MELIPSVKRNAPYEFCFTKLQIPLFTRALKYALHRLQETQRNPKTLYHLWIFSRTICFTRNNSYSSFNRPYAEFFSSISNVRSQHIECSFKFILKVSIEESIVNAPLENKNTNNAKGEVRFKQLIRDMWSECTYILWG
jgi:hypothetical protein